MEVYFKKHPNLSKIIRNIIIVLLLTILQACDTKKNNTTTNDNTNTPKKNISDNTNHKTTDNNNNNKTINNTTAHQNISQQAAKKKKEKILGFLATHTKSNKLGIKEPVVIVLKQKIPSWKENDVLSNQILDISPKISGEIVAYSQSSFAFLPVKEAFKENTTYTFTINPKAIDKELYKDTDKKSFTIKTIEPRFSINTEGLHVQDKKHMKLKATVYSNTNLDIKRIKKCIEVKQGKSKLEFEIQKNENSDKSNINYRIEIKDIERKENTSTVEINWDGSKQNISAKGKLSSRISGLSTFEITNIKTQQQPEQYIHLFFSEILSKSQDLNGKIQLTSSKSKKAIDFKSVISGNVIKIFPEKQAIGEYTLKVSREIKNTVNTYGLKEAFDTKIHFEKIKPDVKLLKNGVIMPDSFNLKINFKAVNLGAVDVTVLKIFSDNILQYLQRNELDSKTSSQLKYTARPIVRKTIILDENLDLSSWNAFSIDLSKLINIDLGAMYRVEITPRLEYSLYCNESISSSNIQEEEINYDQEDEQSAWDYYESYNSNGYYYNSSNPCNKSYYKKKKVAVNLLSSHLGVIAKKEPKSSRKYTIVVTDLLSAFPVMNAKVSFYNFQQQIIESFTTDSKGIVKTENLKQKPFMIVIEEGGQKTFLKLNEGKSLSVSKFDVSGSNAQKGIKGFTYSERGVYQPGDSIHLGFILDDTDNPLPKGHPIDITLLDPYNTEIDNGFSNKNNDGIYRFGLKTRTTDRTGNWKARINIGGQNFEHRIKVETVKPNRLKVNINFEDDAKVLTQKEQGNDIRIHSQWLHGASAKGLNYDLNVTYNNCKTSFKNFNGFWFDDITHPPISWQEVIVSQESGLLINEDGNALIENQHLGQSERERGSGYYRGFLKAHFMAKVYEKSGDFSVGHTSKIISPYQQYVGLITPKGDAKRNMLLTDTEHTFEVATVKDNGKPNPNTTVEAFIYKIDWKWWWDSSKENLSSFHSSNHKNLVHKTTVKTNQQGLGKFNFSLAYPEWGRYLVRIVDAKGHACSKTIYIDWPGWAGKSRKADPSQETMLLFSTDKKRYNVDQTAIVTFPSPKEGRALISIENHQEVLDMYWVDTKEEETKFKLPIKRHYTPNVYINITLLQPHIHTTNDLPIRLYGIMPIAVEDKQTHIQPVLDMPNTLEPEETVEITVSEKDHRAMSYSIAIVDEGLLDLTNFKTPNPWPYFYTRQALGVRTWDIYDYVVGAYGGSINQVFSIGGDGSVASRQSKKTNRFKPMVIVKGPFHINANQSKTHQIKIPKYIGSVRTMVVAVNTKDRAFGKTEKTTAVKKPLMLLTTLPRKVSYQEKIRIPVTVFALEEHIKDVILQIQTDKGVTLMDSNPKKEIQFKQTGDQITYYELAVTKNLNIKESKITVTATSGKEKASYTTIIPITHPNTSLTKSKSITIEPNSKKEINLELFGEKGSNKYKIELSSLPQINLGKRLDYLIKYPHGCIEQTTSSVFPQLYLSSIEQCDAKTLNKIEYNITQGIERLGNFALYNGGMSYWPNQNEGSANDWGTSYAGHFLLEAENLGYNYAIDATLKENWIEYQQKIAKQHYGNNSLFNQAYRLYTLALANHADLSSMNRLKETLENKNSSDVNTKFRLAAAYGVIGHKDIAKEILSDIDQSKILDSNHSENFGSIERNQAMALETYIILEEQNKAEILVKKISKSLSSEKYMNTQTTAYCLLAMAKYRNAINHKGIQANIISHQDKQSVQSYKSVHSLPYKSISLEEDQKINIENQSNYKLYAQVNTTGIPTLDYQESFEKNIKLEVSYWSEDHEYKIDIDKLKQGTNFIIETKVKLIGDYSDVDHIALIQNLASGWEIINERIYNNNVSDKQANYQDFRDNQVITYFDLDQEDQNQVTFNIKATASYLGKFFLPATDCEAMYDNKIHARTEGKWVEVVK